MSHLSCTIFVLSHLSRWEHLTDDTLVVLCVSLLRPFVILHRPHTQAHNSSVNAPTIHLGSCESAGFYFAILQWHGPLTINPQLRKIFAKWPSSYSFPLSLLPASKSKTKWLAKRIHTRLCLLLQHGCPNLMAPPLWEHLYRAAVPGCVTDSSGQGVSSFQSEPELSLEQD